MRGPCRPISNIHFENVEFEPSFRLGLITEFSSGLFSGIRTVEMSLEVASPMMTRRDFLAAVALLRTSRVSFKGRILTFVDGGADYRISSDSRTPLNISREGPEYPAAVMVSNSDDVSLFSALVCW